VLVYFQLGPKEEVTTESGKELNTCGEGTIIYKDEDLCWQRGVMPDKAEDWQAASDYCENLVLAGEDDWRLPTTDELISIVDESFQDIAIDPEYFQDTAAINYWTSSPYKEGLHWYIHFETGYQGFAQDFRENFGVRCVRENTLF
jgi:hypothetical protein